MFLTTELEKMILCGKAEYGTFQASGHSSQLEINQNNHAVIIGISVYPFVALSVGDDFTNLLAVAARSFSQVTIKSGKTLTHFVFRFPFNTIADQLGDRYQVPAMAPINVPMYIPVQQKTYFEWAQSADVDQWLAGLGTYNPRAENEDSPGGYGKGTTGTTIPTLIDMNGNGTFKPIGKDLSSAAVPASGFVGQQIQMPYIAPFVLPTPMDFSRVLGGYTLPLMQVHYVLIDGTMPERMKGSTDSA